MKQTKIRTNIKTYIHDIIVNVLRELYEQRKDLQYDVEYLSKEKDRLYEKIICGPRDKYVIWKDGKWRCIVDDVEKKGRSFSYANPHGLTGMQRVDEIKEEENLIDFYINNLWPKTLPTRENKSGENSKKEDL